MIVVVVLCDSFSSCRLFKGNVLGLKQNKVGLGVVEEGVVLGIRKVLSFVLKLLNLIDVGGDKRGYINGSKVKVKIKIVSIYVLLCFDLVQQKQFFSQLFILLGF